MAKVTIPETIRNWAIKFWNFMDLFLTLKSIPSRVICFWRRTGSSVPAETPDTSRRGRDARGREEHAGGVSEVLREMQTHNTHTHTHAHTRAHTHAHARTLALCPTPLVFSTKEHT